MLQEPHPFIFNQTITGNRTQILRRMLWLRCAMLAVATLTLLLWSGVMDRQFNDLAVASTIAATGALGLVSYLRLRRGGAVSDSALLSHLLTDAIALLILVYLTGRTANPFIYYLLVLVAISATVFNYRISWLFSGGCIAAYTALLYLDVQGHFQHMPQDFQLHLLGMWLNFVGSAVLICFFVGRLATALRDRQILLAKAREDTLKNEQLIGIGTLAASTVHALGTPLSTMAVLLSDMHNELENQEHKNNTTMLLAQIDRCKQTMAKLSLLADKNQPAQGQESVQALMEELANYFTLMSPTTTPKFVCSEECAQQRIDHSLLLHHALINLIDNAIRAARSKVEVAARHEQNHLELDIVDDGPGLPESVLEHWGKPIFTSQTGGLGMGIFLANSTIEQLGGTVTVYNNHSENTHLRIQLPLRNESY